ncbi:MAG TPA: hypothetical protein VGM31_16415 [Puia sp.]|jgi:hypothetical protein
MKVVRKLPLLLLMAAPLLVPVKTHAGIIGDLLKALTGNTDNGNNKDKGKHNGQDNGSKNVSTPAASTNSVPLDGGVVFLVLAGVGLGAKLIYDARAKKDLAGDI